MVDGKSDVPLVSVVVPVFNGERYLRESLDSIIAQTYPRMEVLVMDDASSDDTPNIISSYRDRLKHVRQQCNRGIYGNINDGIAIARGDYIALYHADDVYGPTIVEREVAFFEQHPQTGAVSCQDIFIDADGREQGGLVLPLEVRGGRPLDYSVVFNALLTYKNRFLRFPSCMVPASVYRDVGVYRDEEFFNTSDLEMWLRIAERYPIAVLEESLFRYRQGHGSSAQRYHHLRTDEERFFTIMDLYLEKGGRGTATRQALAAYEAHRAEDRLMRVVNHYILGRTEPAREVLDQICSRHILGSPRIQRGRLLVLFLALQALVRVARIPLVARMFYRHWYPGKTGERC